MARWLKIILVCLVVVVVALGSLPWWLGSVLRPILRSKSITFERYERVDYAHFRLHNAVYENAHVRVTAAEVWSPTPVVWLAQRLGHTPPTLSADHWSVRILPQPDAPAAPTTRPTVGGPAGLAAVFRRIEPPLMRWLPRVELHHGSILGLASDIIIDDGLWQRGALNLQGVHALQHVFVLGIAPAANNAFTLSGHTAGNAAQVQLAWSDADVKGAGTVWGQPLQLSAVFPAQGWLPEDASAVAAHWSLPARRVKLGAPYAQIHGDAELHWHDGGFNLSLDAAAEPEPDAKAPPLSARLLAHGNFRELTLTTLDVEAPFATAKLTAPVIFSRDRPVAAESAELTIEGDLSKQVWVEAHGKVKGTVSVTADTAAARQTFRFECDGVELPGLALKHVQALGVLHWPQLELTALRAELDETSSAEAHGTIDWQKHKVIGAALEAKLHSGWFARWLPTGFTWDTAQVSVTADGPLAAPRTQGSLQLTQARWAALQPMTIHATWQGAGTRLETLTGRVAAGHAALEFTGALDAHRLQLNRFEFAAGDQKIWTLAAPASLVWSPVWQIDSLQLTGPDSALALKGNGGPNGQFELTVGRFDAAWLQDWVKLTGPAWQLRSLQASGRIADGALIFDAALTAQINTPEHPAEVKLTASGDAQGLQLKELTVTEAGRVLTRATGRLPVTWRTEPTAHLQFDENAPLELSASTDPDSPLWATLTGATGLQLTRPEAKINLTGSLHQPVGNLEVRVAHLEFAPTKTGVSLPGADELVLDVHFDRSRVTLQNFSAKLEGQAVQASGQVPINDAGWRQLWHQPTAFDWSEAEAKLEIANADLAPFAQHAPNFIAARGQLRARLELARGGKFSGELHLTNAASRPLGPFGTLQDVNADLAFAGRTLTVRTLTARLGGEPVTVDGSVTFKPDAPPHFSLGLKGSRLALMRTPELLVRSDLELHATTDAAGVTRLTGNAKLRDSLVLANFNSLLPSGPRGVAREPPYFAVQAEPFRHWPLDIQVRGQEAIKIRTTVYNGTASARFHLTGTLGEPRAVGDVSADQGQVLFPFAVFRVQQGSVRLSEADSFHAKINLVATSQRRDYQLRLEVTGQLPNPIITMSSTPALEATDVLLMVMTGRPPTGDTATSSAQRMALLGAYLGRGIFEDLGASGENRLEISSGEQITNEGRETYEIEYKLGERWSLVGEYDQFDSYNADIKRRIYIQESTPREKK